MQPRRAGAHRDHLPHRRFGARALPRPLAAVGAQHLPARVEDVERHRVGRRLGQPEVDLCSRRRILGIGRVGTRRLHASKRSGVAMQDRRSRREELRVRARHLVRQLVQRREVVEDPEGASLRRDEQVAVLHPHVGDRDDREVELERRPVRAVIERDVHPELGPGVQQPLAVGVLAHHARRCAVGNAVGSGREQRPRRTIVIGLVDKRPEVAKEVARDRVVRRALAVRRRFELRRAAAVGGTLEVIARVVARRAHQTARGDVLPCLAVVTGDVERSVVGARPDDARLEHRLADRVDHREVLLARHVDRDRLAARRLLSLGRD